ncbi:MAG: S8 family serine peptidase [Bacteroidetes bacterium]|nr:S8 family serine peptidase [Bacteroidota bacterium]
MPLKLPYRLNCIFFFGVIAFLFSSTNSQAQIHNYFVEFKDKDTLKFSINKPENFLTKRAITRRHKQGIAIDYNDLPINHTYINAINQTGIKVLFASKWFNAAVVEVSDSSLTYKLDSFPFLKTKKRLRKRGKMKVKSISTENKNVWDSYLSSRYGEGFPQIHLHNGEALNEMGYRGEGMLIAVADAGFYNIKEQSAFKDVWQQSRVIDSHDFVGGRKGIYNGATHGMLVMSVMAANIPGKLIGTAPAASYILLRTESDTSESLVEEDAWVAAVEYADSLGADVISTSLGYTNFDDSLLSHTYADMNGKTSRASIAATIASQKGMLLLNSAGNEGNKPWHYIGAPADADGILTVGSVDTSGLISSFSSHGPTADGRVKPDICGMGRRTVCAGLRDGEISYASGTSLSCPILAGLTTCLWQAFPDRSNKEIMDVIRQSSNHYFSPDDSYGYGIPDFLLAFQMLKYRTQMDDNTHLFSVYPNPFGHSFTLSLYEVNAASIHINLTDVLGRTVFEKSINNAHKNYLGRYQIDVPDSIPNGLYIATVKTETKVYSVKLVKDVR